VSTAHGRSGWEGEEHNKAAAYSLSHSPALLPDSNGAYYYYLSEPGKNMQETVVDVLHYWDSLELPYRHVMYDSWW
jgi:hypothetical protein